MAILFELNTGPKFQINTYIGGQPPVRQTGRCWDDLIPYFPGSLPMQVFPGSLPMQICNNGITIPITFPITSPRFNYQAFIN